MSVRKLIIFGKESPVEIGNGRLNLQTYNLIKSIEVNGKDFYLSIKSDGFVKLNKDLEAFLDENFGITSQLIKYIVRMKADHTYSWMINLSDMSNENDGLIITENGEYPYEEFAVVEI